MKHSAVDSAGQILLVNPLVHDFSYFHLWAQPLFLYSLAGYLRRQGYGVTLLDGLDAMERRRASRRDRDFGIGPVTKMPIATPVPLKDLKRRYFQYGLSEPEMVRRLAAAPRPDSILVSGLMTYWYPGLRRTLELLRGVWPESPIYLGGKYVQIVPEHAAATPGIKGLLLGRTFAEVSRELSRLLGHPGLASDAPLPPLPPLDFFRDQTAAALFLGRGCPRRCPYCLYSGQPAAVVRYAPEAIAEWILEAAEQLGLRHFAFLDDALLYRWEESLGPILELVLRRRADLSFHCPNGLSVAALEPSLVSLLKRAGFRTLRLSVETVSPGRQAALGEKWHGDQLSKALATLAGAGFSPADLGVYLLVGLPDQARGEIEADVDYFLRLGLRPHLAEYSPLPGTALWQQARAASRYPLAEEPLTHNKTLLPCRAADYSLAAHEALKEKIRRHFHTPRAVAVEIVGGDNGA